MDQRHVAAAGVDQHLQIGGRLTVAQMLLAS
jgi:hypothetical protein